MAVPVVSEEQLKQILGKRGFEPTDERTATGRFWRSRDTGKHVLVPDSVQGFYPDWLLADLEGITGKIDPWAARRMNPH
jgi:hypothetical protein